MSENKDPSGFLGILEKNYGVEACWGWVQDWIWEEGQCDADEHVTLSEYLALRAGNQDESREYTLEDLLKCAQRELAFRHNVYQKRGMTDARRREIALMEGIVDHFEKLTRK